jgi:zinc transport system ATP-binding protein
MPLDGNGPLIEAADVGHGYGGSDVLQHVEFSVAAGEIVSLIGPNGAGKTTLVRIMLGLLAPRSGRVRRRPGLRIGYMPQRFHLEPSLPITVRRFLALAQGVGRPAILAALGEVGAAALLDHPMLGLSGGETQRVLLARALIREPDLLVLDEPVRGVDIGGQAELYDLIARIQRRRGCGVLLISHDLHLVMAATDRVVCLNHHVCCAGRPEAVSEHPEYLALFGPAAGRRIAVYTHHHDHAHGLAGEIVTEADDHRGHGERTHGPGHAEHAEPDPAPGGRAGAAGGS